MRLERHQRHVQQRIAVHVPPTNATYCFHNAIPEWAAFGGLIRQMQAAGNATTGGDVWWQNPAVGRLRISGAAVDLESLTLATPSSCRRRASTGPT